MLTKKYRVIHKEELMILSGEFTGVTNVGYGWTGVEFDTEEEMDNYILENNLVLGEIMSRTNIQLPIRGKRGNDRRVRGLVSGGMMIADKLIAITVENKYLVPYLPESEVDTNIQGLIQYAVFTGAQLVQYQGEDLNGTTTCLMNIDNLTCPIFEQLQAIAPKIYLEWMETHNLHSDGVKVESNDWDEIASMSNLTWDKYVI